MDTITHALVGAALGSGKLKEKAGSLAVPAFIAGAVFPDSDIVLRFVSPEFYILEHRGATHSLLLWPLWTLLLSGIFYLFKKQSFNKYIPFILALGILSHLYMDLVTSWGIMLFYPLSRYRTAWDQMFIIDLYYSGAFILLLIFIWKRFLGKKSLWSQVALGFFIFYHLFTTINHFAAKRIIKEEVSKAGATGDLQVFPGIANPFSWVGVASKGDDYIVSPVNIFTNSREPLETLTSEKGQPWARKAIEQPIAGKLATVARLPAFTKEKNSDNTESIYFYDMQYTIRKFPWSKDNMRIPLKLQQVYENGKMISEKML